MDYFIDQLTNPIAAVGHLNYILVILCVSMSSMRWLRVFGIASGVVGVFYYGFLISDNISATWEGVFAAVNAVQLALVLLAGRRRSLSEDEQMFITTVMPTLDTSLRPRILKLARWQTREPDEVLVAEGQEKPDLVFIARGAASVEKTGTIVGVCGPGDFLGEMSFLTGNPASATVRVANEIRCCVFDPGVLKAMIQKNPGIKQALEYSFNRNLVGKLERMNEAKRDRELGGLADRAAPAPVEVVVAGETVAAVLLMAEHGAEHVSSVSPAPDQVEPDGSTSEPAANT